MSVIQGISENSNSTGDKSFANIFKNSSKTFYYSSLLFPKDVQEQIAILYAFVRIVDNFVDQKEQQRAEFYEFCNAFEKARNDENYLGFKYLDNPSHDKILKSFITLEKKFQFDPAWIESFLYAMDMDLNKKTYDKMKDVTEYMYGSASVIGLFICKIVGAPAESFPFAQTLGTAFQYINFIRDIDEDLQDLGRVYIPQNELQKFGLVSLDEEFTRKFPDRFKALMDGQIGYFREWQKAGLEGLKYLPKKYAVAIKTAADNYEWTAKQIQKNPFIIYQKKVKPSKVRVILTGLKNLTTKEY
jgi:15-cis-phytoene synthase